MKDLEKIFTIILEASLRRRPSNEPNYLLMGFSGVILLSVFFGATVSFLLTRKHYRNYVDPQVLHYIKNPSSAKEAERKIISLIQEKDLLGTNIATLSENIQIKENRLSEIENRYSELKSKITNEKIIKEEAFKEKVAEIQEKYNQQLKEAQAKAHGDGVATGVIGTIGIQYLLDD